MAEPFTLAAVQAAPVFFDKARGVQKACDLIADAGRAGAALAAFGESWLPGYPFFVDAAPDALWWDAAAEYAANAVDIPGPETEALCAAAKAAGADVVIGVAERSHASAATLFCTLLFIGRNGSVLGRHRKLRPTHHERSVWADGDAEGLRVHDRPYGRLGGLNCWEHNIVLPGFALIAQGVQIHVAAWPGQEPEAAPAGPVWARQLVLSRSFASQAGAYVVCAAGLRLHEHTPERYRALAPFEHNGMSCIIDPWGEVIAGPMTGEGLLLAKADLDRVRKAKIACDAAGHYSRPDLFELRLEGRTVYGKGG
ncbi:MAG: carbon-nitrogen hydrolase family protein [Pseudomonadota bacterium]|nr:carbon-nitrogen hydrolase family protein [Pseudomonadota bacterium]